eukprot:434288-Alexandrium_andersonii.AAC.1
MLVPRSDPGPPPKVNVVKPPWGVVARCEVNANFCTWARCLSLWPTLPCGGRGGRAALLLQRDGRLFRTH